jgi:hypothetical protein
MKTHTISAQIYQRMIDPLIDKNEEVTLSGVIDNRTGIEVPRPTISALVNKINKKMFTDKRFYTRRSAEGDLVLGVYKCQK